MRRPDFLIDPDALIGEAEQIGFRELAVSARVAARVKEMALIHHDPFDRLLVAQAIADPCILLTADGKLSAYSDLVSLI